MAEALSCMGLIDSLVDVADVVQYHTLSTTTLMHACIDHTEGEDMDHHRHRHFIQ